MPEIFEARNELEEQLLAAQDGRLPPEDFMRSLLTAQVFMPILERTRIKGFQRSDRAQPLTLTAEDGAPVLVLFTSPERAQACVRDYPGYEGGLLVEFKWVLEKMGTGYGIALNPGWEVGIDVEPEMVQRLAEGQGPS